jgi:hypothetical protein
MGSSSLRLSVSSRSTPSTRRPARGRGHPGALAVAMRRRRRRGRGGCCRGSRRRPGPAALGGADGLGLGPRAAVEPSEAAALPVDPRRNICVHCEHTLKEDRTVVSEPCRPKERQCRANSASEVDHRLFRIPHGSVPCRLYKLERQARCYERDGRSRCSDRRQLRGWCLHAASRFQGWDCDPRDGERCRP